MAVTIGRGGRRSAWWHHHLDDEPLRRVYERKLSLVYVLSTEGDARGGGSVLRFDTAHGLRALRQNRTRGPAFSAAVPVRNGDLLLFDAGAVHSAPRFGAVDAPLWLRRERARREGRSAPAGVGHRDDAAGGWRLWRRRRKKPRVTIDFDVIVRGGTPREAAATAQLPPIWLGTGRADASPLPRGGVGALLGDAHAATIDGDLVFTAMPAGRITRAPVAVAGAGAGDAGAGALGRQVARMPSKDKTAKRADGRVTRRRIDWAATHRSHTRFPALVNADSLEKLVNEALLQFAAALGSPNATTYGTLPADEVGRRWPLMRHAAKRLRRRYFEAGEFRFSFRRVEEFRIRAGKNATSAPGGGRDLVAVDLGGGGGGGSETPSAGGGVSKRKHGLQWDMHTGKWLATHTTRTRAGPHKTSKRVKHLGAFLAHDDAAASVAVAARSACTGEALSAIVALGAKQKQRNDESQKEEKGKVRPTSAYLGYFGAGFVPSIRPGPGVRHSVDPPADAPPCALVLQRPAARDRALSLGMLAGGPGGGAPRDFLGRAGGGFALPLAEEGRVVLVPTALLRGQRHAVSVAARGRCAFLRLDVVPTHDADCPLRK